ncbi:hypothetical protein GCM10010230_53370 [Streptomyces narbonensis]|nr:hypothetical protein GCM10010230_53370 [Streptomyces narbonensis]
MSAYEREQDEHEGDHARGHQHQLVHDPGDGEQRRRHLYQYELLQSERTEVSGTCLEPR